MFNAESIIAETITAVQQQQERLAQALYFSGVEPVLPTQPLVQSPLRDQLELLVAVANGDHGHEPGIVAETAQAVCEVLFTSAMTYEIPSAFWRTELGQVIAHCQLWLRGDDLISITEAAQILRGDTKKADLMAVRRLIAHGALTEYFDPTEKNPVRQPRVSRTEVEALHNA